MDEKEKSISMKLEDIDITLKEDEIVISDDLSEIRYEISSNNRIIYIWDESKSKCILYVEY